MLLVSILFQSRPKAPPTHTNINLLNHFLTDGLLIAIKLNGIPLPFLKKDGEFQILVFKG